MSVKNDYNSFWRQLSKVGDIRFRRDLISQVLYSTDASIYQLFPQGAIFPRDLEQLRTVVRLAHRYRVPLIPRGSATSLAGQCTGDGVALVLSGHFARILSLDPAERTAVVQPGVIASQLNAAAAEFGLFFPPDPSTADRATVGGMVSNNAAGARSLLYGRTSDYVSEIRALLSDGSEAVFRPLSSEELSQRLSSDTLEGEIYRRLRGIIEEYRDDIAHNFPDPSLIRRNSGYALDKLAAQNPPASNLIPLLCGSEGTLAIITELKLRLLPIPPYKKTAVLKFSDFFQALESIPGIVALGPACAELVDRFTLSLAEKNPAASEGFAILGSVPEAILLVEFVGESLELLEERVSALAGAVSGAEVLELSPGEAAALWQMRRAGLGMLSTLPGPKKPVTFVEDGAVPPDKLAAYIREFSKLMEEFELECTYYAHASVGELHPRPLLDLSSPKDREKMRVLAPRVVDLIRKYGGSLSGEHGDGRLRSPFHGRFFGSRLERAFREVKEAFDPRGILNPGKLGDPPPLSQYTRHLRPHLYPQPFQKVLAFRDSGGFESHLSSCNGAGSCVKPLESGGGMCPTYRATGREEFSTRGRANLLKTSLAIRGPELTFSDPEIAYIIQSCLGCKACRSECPSKVDLSKVRMEFLHQYRAIPAPDVTEEPDLLPRGEKGSELPRIPKDEKRFRRDLLLALSPQILRSLRKIPLANYFLRSRLFRRLASRFLKLDSRRLLPAVSRRSVGELLRKNRKKLENFSINSQLPRVLFFADPYTDLYFPQVGFQAIYLLRRFGYPVELAPMEDDGRALLSLGFLERARALASRNWELLEPYLSEGEVYLVGIEPASIITFRDEYPELLELSEGQVELLRSRCLGLDEFLVGELEAGRWRPEFRSAEGEEYLFHPHCFQRAWKTEGAYRRLFSLIPGLKVEETDGGCCGMAGAFGYLPEFYDLSVAVAEVSLLPKLRESRGKGVVAAGFSCRSQVKDLSDGWEEVLHPVELLFKFLSGEGRLSE